MCIIVSGIVGNGLLNPSIQFILFSINNKDYYTLLLIPANITEQYDQYNYMTKIIYDKKK